MLWLALVLAVLYFTVGSPFLSDSGIKVQPSLFIGPHAGGKSGEVSLSFPGASHPNSVAAFS